MQESKDRRLDSGELAALVIDALLRADVMALQDVARAIEIAAEEIEARKAIGDY